jgi:hypothetical protein
MKKLIIVLLLPFLFTNHTKAALEIPDKPLYNVYDDKNYLRYDSVNKVIAFNKKHKTKNENLELFVYTTDTLDNEDPNEFANKLLEKWKAKDHNNIVIIMSIKDRKHLIIPSNNLQETLNKDVLKKINDSLLSDIRRGDYDTTLFNMVTRIDDELKEKPVEKNEFNVSELKRLFWLIPLAALIYIISIILKLRTEYENTI